MKLADYTDELKEEDPKGHACLVYAKSVEDAMKHTIEKAIGDAFEAAVYRHKETALIVVTDVIEKEATVGKWLTTVSRDEITLTIMLPLILEISSEKTTQYRNFYSLATIARSESIELNARELQSLKKAKIENAYIALADTIIEYIKNHKVTKVNLARKCKHKNSEEILNQLCKAARENEELELTGEVIKEAAKVNEEWHKELEGKEVTHGEKTKELAGNIHDIHEWSRISWHIPLLDRR